ncbi:hypothetical protein EDB87DRAFT_1687048 [Lactarius vividus]|nr:hypothetical protein EDB87DRAFT_1687048 [Lactarius vividus]
MSQPHPEGVNVTGADMDPGRGGHSYPPQSAQIQESQGTSNFVDGSGPIFSMYLEMATEEDKKMAEGWAADADGILIFTGLFSAAVASLISVSIQDIRQNPQDTSNFYLSNIYQTLADPNRSDISSSLPSSPPPFSPPSYAVWVNALLFLSLVISISCALLATLLQQWARRYLKVTQPRYALHKRARIRAFFFEGVDKFLLSWAVEALPALLHVSLFLFFAGISVFLWNVHLTIFKSVVSWISICTVLYGCITFIPILRHDSPYHTPLSLPAWNIIAGIPFVMFRIFRFTTFVSMFVGFPCLYFGPPFLRFAEKTYDRFEFLEKSYRKLLLQGMQKTVEKTALNSPLGVDTRAFLWTFDSLDEDHELERFFSGLPGFRNSTVVGDPFPGLTEEQKWKLIWAVIGLLDRTFSSDLLPEQVKRRRAVVCAKAINPADISRSLFSLIFKRITLEDHQYGPVQSAEIVHLVRGWGDGVQAPMIIQAIVFAVVAKARRRDDTWFILASNELGIREAVLRDYAARGDSLSLAILIHITRQQFSHFREHSWPEYVFSKFLVAASKFNAQDTSPELQHEFCALWNQIVLEARNNSDVRMIWFILASIQTVYIALHHETDDATIFEAQPYLYPMCNVPGHRLDSAPHIHGSSTPTASTHTVLDDDATPVLASPANAESPSTSIPGPHHLSENLADVPPLDNFRPAYQTVIESPASPVMSPYVPTAGTVQDIAASVLRYTPKSSISPPAVFSLHHNEDLPVPSDEPDFPSSASS